MGCISYSLTYSLEKKKKNIQFFFWFYICANQVFKSTQTELKRLHASFKEWNDLNIFQTKSKFLVFLLFLSPSHTGLMFSIK